MYKLNNSYAFFDLTLPFRVMKKQIIYVEDKFDREINGYIEKNYEKLLKLLHGVGYDFVYVPCDFKNRMKNSVLQDIYDVLFSFLTEGAEPLKPGFICYQSTEKNVHIFSYLEIGYMSEYDFLKLIEWYIQNIKIWILPEGCYPKTKAHPTMHEWVIADKSEGKIQYNKKIDFSGDGISPLNKPDFREWVLVILTKPQKLSKLRVTEDYRILLTDYDNLEVHLTPLQKAVYFLFLKHPEGIFFKDLSDYKEELKNIYKKLSYRDTIEKSINFIIDSTRYNTVNENCSRIREAFIKKIDERLAENYCITGGRLNPNRIPLDGDLVRIEADI